MFDVHDCIGFITNRGAKVVCEAMNEQFKKKDITRVQWMALYYISHQNGSMTQKELASAMMISEPTTVHLVERMEQEGFITRTSSTDNYRAKFLGLTEKGEQILKDLFPLVVEFNREGIDGISEEELDVFKRVMHKMIENVQTIDL